MLTTIDTIFVQINLYNVSSAYIEESVLVYTDIIKINL